MRGKRWDWRLGLGRAAWDVSQGQSTPWIFSCRSRGATESIGAMKWWDQIYAFESLLQLHHRDGFGGAELAVSASMEENPEQRPEEGSLA